MDKILSQLSLQAVAWLLFVSLIQVYGEIFGERNITERFEEFEVWPENYIIKLGLKKA